MVFIKNLTTLFNLKIGFMILILILWNWEILQIT